MSANLVIQWKPYFDRTLWGRALIWFWTLNPVWALALALYAMHVVSCRVLYRSRTMVHPYGTQTLKTSPGGYAHYGGRSLDPIQIQQHVVRRQGQKNLTAQPLRA